MVRPLRGTYVDPARTVAPEAFYRFRDADAVVAGAHAALAVLPSGAVLGDETAAFFLCGSWPPDARPRVVVPAPATCARRPHTLLVREAALPGADVLTVGGLRLTRGARTAIDLARRTSRPAALAAVDALLHAGATTPHELRTAVHRWEGHRGVLQARAVIDLADGRAESPGESWIRLALHDAGLGPVDTQVPAAGGRYRIDILVGGRVIVEFEGSHHDQPNAQLADRQRFNALAALPGTHVLRYGSRDLADLGSIVADVRAALQRVDHDVARVS